MSSADPIRPESVESNDQPRSDPIAEPVGPPLPSAVPPAPPHPSFGWSLLWCFLFLIVTQVIPGFIGAAVVVISLIVQGEFQAAGANLVNRLQGAILMPTLLMSQVSGVCFSFVVLRLVAGAGWARKVALRLPRLWQLLVVILAFPSLPILASGAYALAKDYLPGIPEAISFYLAQAIAIPLVWLAVRLAAGKGWNQRLGRQPFLVQLGLVSAGCAATVYVGTAAYWLLSPHLLRIPYDGPALMEEMVEQFREWPVVVAVLLVGLGPGLNEELWCRGFLGRGLVGNYGIVLGVVLTSYLFGLIHLEPHQATMAALMGIVLHSAYLLTRSLLVPILLHFLNNSLSVAGDRLFEELAKIDTAPEEIHWLIYAASALLMAAATWALYRGRARFVSVVENPLAWRPAFPSVAHPPAGSGTVLLRPWPGILAMSLVVLTAAALVGAFYLDASGRLGP